MMINGVITKGVGGLYTVDTPEGVILCRPRGIFRKNNLSPLVGDRVSISEITGGEGIIEVIHERSSLLARPKVANITQALIVFSYRDPDLHMDLLDRFIINCEAAGVESVVCFNKLDLITDGDKEDFYKIRDMYENCGYQTLAVSACSGEGIENIAGILDGEITVFAGPSGAGKSSISNALTGTVTMETGDLSAKIRRGKHTTRHSQLIKIGGNAYIVDSPGFSSVFFEGVNRSNLKHLFREFLSFEGKCRFINCNHLDEPDCEVKAMVENGVISRIRYDRYRAFFEEVGGE